MLTITIFITKPTITIATISFDKNRFWSTRAISYLIEYSKNFHWINITFQNKMNYAQHKMIGIRNGPCEKFVEKTATISSRTWEKRTHQICLRVNIYWRTFISHPISLLTDNGQYHTFHKTTDRNLCIRPDRETSSECAILFFFFSILKIAKARSRVKPSDWTAQIAPRELVNRSISPVNIQRHSLNTHRRTL